MLNLFQVIVWCRSTCCELVQLTGSQGPVCLTHLDLADYLGPGRIQQDLYTASRSRQNLSIFH
jgi:hypothetical protein